MATTLSVPCADASSLQTPNRTSPATIRLVSRVRKQSNLDYAAASYPLSRVQPASWSSSWAALTIPTLLI